MDYNHLLYVGRGLSVLFDLGTVILLFKLGTAFFGRKTGLLASFFYATSVFPVQLSHFYTVDIMLNFFIWLSLWFLWQFYRSPSTRTALKVGAAFGLALATKISASFLLVGVGTALLVDLLLLGLKFWRELEHSWWHKAWLLIKRVGKRKVLGDIGWRLFGWGGIIILSAAWTFLILEPFALIDFPNFWRQIQEQSRMAKDAYIFPYTLQYVGTVPYWYQLRNLFLWGMGIGLGSISLIGTVWYLTNLIRRLLIRGDYDQEASELIINSFWLVYFWLVGGFAVKYMRYFLPLYPAFILAGTVFLLRLVKKLEKYGGRWLILGTVLIFHIGWLLSFISIYSHPHSRVQASEWINRNISSGSVLAVEHWDDRLPLWGSQKYRFVEMPMYEQDNSLFKWQEVKRNLEEADYLILASNRLYVPLTKLADCSKYRVCYPRTAQYYRDLFSGRLSFKKIVEFSSYPSLGIGSWRLTISDDTADESFTVYDHPKVIIFQKIRR
jgi:4-amino-4-deoxy-L-arabinose transferase-like glycosyltransferase